MSVELATAYISIVPETSKIAPGVRKALGGVEGEASRSGKSMGGKLMAGLGVAAKGAAIGAGAAVAAGFGTALVKGFNRLTAIENAEAKLTGLGHSASSVATIMDDALAAVKGTAFGLGDAASAAASAVASGIKPGKDLQRNLKLVGDAATIAGTDFNEMASIFNKVSASGVIQGEELAQLGDRGIPILQLLGEELGVSAAEVRKLAAEGKVSFADFQNAMEAGMGGAAMESGKTLQGSLANVGASLGRLGASMLSGVFPMIAPMLAGVTGWLDKMGPTAERMGAAIGGALTWAGERVSAFVGQFQAGEGAGGRFRDVLTAVRDAAVAAFTWVRDNAVPVIQGFVEEFRNSEGAGGKFRDILTRVWGAAKTAFGWLRDNALPVLLDLADFVMKRLWPDIKAAFLDRILPAMVEVGKVIKAAWETVIQPALSALWVFVRDVLAPFLVDFYENGIKPTFKLIGDAISGAWNKVIKPAFGFFRDGFANLKRWVNDAKDGIARGWKGLVNAIARPINAVIDKVNAFLTNLKDGLNKIPGVNIAGSWTIRKIILDTSSATVGGGGRQALAAGGRVGGYSPNDRADNIPAMLTAGEYVLPVKATRSLASRFGPGFLEALRSGLPGFASGGPVSHGNKRTGGFLADSWEWLADVFKDAKGWVKGKIESLIGGFGESWPGMAAKGAARSTAGGIGDWIMANAFGGGSASGGSRANYGGKYGWAPQGLPWQSIWSLIRLVAPEATMTSNFRPGAITASGVPSLHGQGRAVDIVSPNMRATFLKILPLLKWSQLFHSPMGGAQIGYRDAIVHRTHFDHIHAALADGGLVKPFVADSGALLKPGLNLLDNRTGGPEPLVRGDRDLRLADDQIDEWLDGLRDIMRTENRRLVDMMVSADR